MNDDVENPTLDDGDTGADASAGPIVTAKHGVLKRLYHGENRANIVGRWKLWFAISGVLLLIGVATLATRGLNLGIDFTGGTIWKAEAGKASVSDVQSAMADLGYKDVQVQEVTEVSGGKELHQIQVEAEASADPTKATTKALDQATKDLGEARSAMPNDVRGQFSRVYGNLSELQGPFAQDVPAPLAALQKQIAGVEAVVKKAAPASKVNVARTQATAMEKNVEKLSDLEDVERAKVSQDVTNKLAELTGTPADKITVNTVGPSWGKQISDKAQTALIVFLLAIALFITIRFEAKMALATVVALFHDLLMVVGIYALFGFPVTPGTVVALLTMLGFSIYDGIVVFDRVNENTRLLTGRSSKMNYTEMANLSLNQVLMRSLNTSITTLLPILSVLVVGSFILGASTLEEFGLALFLGLLSGAYSSLFIATPLLALLKEREPRYRDLRRQIAERGHGSVEADQDADADDDPVKTAVLAGGASRPRPRKQGKKR